MRGLVRDVLHLQSGKNLSGSARLTNFNPNCLVFSVRGGSAITKSDLEKILVTINFKNSVGNSIAVANNLPLHMICDLTDYLAGFGLLGNDLNGAFYLDIGKYILKADDELTFSVSAAGLSTGLALSIFAIDTKVSKEQLVSYAYIKGKATQAYQQANVMTVYLKVANPSPDVFVTVDDYFGSNNISELAVCSIGAALGSAEDFDGFGTLFVDTSGLSQPVTIRCGSDSEELLVKQWNFDDNRIGFANQDFLSVQSLAEHISQTNAVKARCLRDFYGA